MITELNLLEFENGNPQGSSPNTPRWVTDFRMNSQPAKQGSSLDVKNRNSKDRIRPFNGVKISFIGLQIKQAILISLSGNCPFHHISSNDF